MIRAFDPELFSVLQRLGIDRPPVVALEVGLDDRHHALGHGAVGGIGGPAEVRGQHHVDDPGKPG